jgi:hypothetical protein
MRTPVPKTFLLEDELPINMQALENGGSAQLDFSKKVDSTDGVKQTQCIRPFVFLTKISHHNTSVMCRLGGGQGRKSKRSCGGLNGRIDAGFKA